MAATTNADVNLDELIDPRLIRQWLLWGMAWLMFMPAVGAYLRDVHLSGLPGASRRTCSSGGYGRCTSTA